MRKSAVFLFLGLVAVAVCVSEPHISKVETLQKPATPTKADEKPESAPGLSETRTEAVGRPIEAHVSEVKIQLDADELTKLKMSDANSYFRVVHSMNQDQGMLTDNFQLSAEERKQAAEDRTGRRLLAYLEKMKKPAK